MDKIFFLTISICILFFPSLTHAGDTGGKQESILAAKNIRAGEIITFADLLQPEKASKNGTVILSYLIGKEAKRGIYKNFPVTIKDVKLPTIVKRNTLIQLEYESGLFQATTNARALDAGAEGETIRVMNLSSKVIVTATIIADGRARVQ